jgi:hypothetical protein
VSTPGTWCLRQDLATSGDGDNAITVAADDVVIDCNGHAIRFAGGPSANRWGIRADDRFRVTARRCVVSGFYVGIGLYANEGVRAAYVVEDNVIEDGGYTGITVYGDGSAVRRNRIARFTPVPVPNSITGIRAFYGVDIRDNTIEDLAGGSTAFATGILGALGPGQAIEGNRIRRLSGTGVNGIRVDTSTGAKVSGNELVGDGVNGIGVRCLGEVPGETRVGDNIIAGFPEALVADGYCGNLGTNDISP